MNTFSNLPLFVESLILQASKDCADGLLDQAEAAAEECIQLLTLLNKTAFYAADNDSAEISISELAEATTSLSELSEVLIQISKKSN